MLDGIGYDYLTNETKYPNVARWFKEITGRDSWKAVAAGVPKGL
jgi:glutathione S-transferase